MHLNPSMVLLFWSDASLWEKALAVVVWGVLGIVALLVVYLIAIVVYALVTFWGIRLLFTIRPWHCCRSGNRFSDSEEAYYALNHDRICVLCRSLAG